jgi:hypothetical protein
VVTVVRARNASLELTHEIDQFVSLTMVLRHRRLSAWVLELPADTAAALALMAPGAGIVVVRDGTTILSGPRTFFTRRWSADGDVVTVEGVDDLILVADRTAHPDPSAGIVDSVTAQEHDVRTGELEDVVSAYVEANLGPSAVASRRAPSLTVAASQGRGTTVTGRARWQNLLSFLDGLSVSAGDLGFSITDQLDGSLQFACFQPADLTASVIFSPEFGNLSGFTYSDGRPAASVAIIAGGGEGVARTYVETVGSAAATWGRVEEFGDRRDTTDLGELQQAAAEMLEERAPVSGLSIVPLDVDAITYGVDYSVGDMVTVRIDAVDLSEVVREVTIAIGPEGETITPNVSTPSGSSSLALFDEIRRLRSGMRNLERNL